MTERQWFIIAKGAASVAFCALGAVSMWVTHGETGIGWTALILFLMWC